MFHGVRSAYYKIMKIREATKYEMGYNVNYFILGCGVLQSNS
jgi:hypothetical protein